MKIQRRLQVLNIKKQGIKQFKMLDFFDLSVIRRAVHSYFSRNESPTLKKLLKQLKEDIDFPYGKTNLYNLLKKLGFGIKEEAEKEL